MGKVHFKSLIVSTVLAVSLVFSAGCVFPQATETAPQSPPAANSTSEVNSASTVDPSFSIPLGESPAPVLPSIADVVAKAKPSVVAINTEATALDFFGTFTQKGAGSGWIIREDGIVITNNHVIEGASIINVTLDDGRTFQVFSSSVATDPIADLAVLRISASNLPALKVGDSTKLRIGDWVVAMGNALGEGISATHGIVSRTNASIAIDQSEMLDNLIQTNAAINVGNSGGPLLNMAGEVIGITSAKLSAVGVEGMGYAISTESAVPIIESLISTGYVIRPWLGVTLYTVDQFVIQRNRLSVNTGVLVINVAVSSPAEKAGLEVGDVITKFGDKEITDDNELIRAIQSGKVNQDVEITFWRGTTQNTTRAILTESPPPG